MSSASSNAELIHNAEIMIKAGRILLYVAIFIIGMASMGYWHLPQVLPYFMGISVLAATILSFLTPEGEIEHEESNKSDY